MTYFLCKIAAITNHIIIIFFIKLIMYSKENFSSVIILVVYSLIVERLFQDILFFSQNRCYSYTRLSLFRERYIYMWCCWNVIYDCWLNLTIPTATATKLINWLSNCVNHFHIPFKRSVTFWWGRFWQILN